MAIGVEEAIRKLKYLIFLSIKNTGKKLRRRGNTKFCLDGSVATLQ